MWTGLVLLGLALLYGGLCLTAEPVSFGGDADAFRVAESALGLTRGRYIPSRLPGYPLHERLVALVVDPENAVPAKLVSAAFALLAVVAFALILNRRHRTVLPPALLVLAFGLWPALVRSSFVVMDYPIGLALFLCSLLGLLAAEDRGRSWPYVLLAGICAGLAVAARLGYVLYIGSVVLVMVVRWVRKREERATVGRHLLAFVAGSLAGLPFFIPLFDEYGFSFLTYYAVLRWEWADFLYNNGVLYVRLFSHVAVLAGLLFFLIHDWRRGLLRPWCTRSPAIGGAVVFVVLLGLFHLNKPYEAEYLLPVLPVVLLYLGTRPAGYGRAGRCGMALLLAGVVSGNILTPDLKLAAGVWHGSTAASWTEGLTVREYEAQADDGRVYPVMTAMRQRPRFASLFQERYGVHPPDFDAVGLVGYSFYVRRHVWLHDLPMFLVDDSILVTRHPEPYVFIVLPYERFIEPLLAHFRTTPDGRPGRVLLVFRNPAAAGEFEPLFQEARAPSGQPHLQTVAILGESQAPASFRDALR
ncbi:MAG: hypothetical protein JXQ27_02070 [Acidobacteria bacterium]|nr:hypothetical protein [Acidobacteriota bacterium]